MDASTQCAAFGRLVIEHGENKCRLQGSTKIFYKIYKMHSHAGCTELHTYKQPKPPTRVNSTLNKLHKTAVGRVQTAREWSGRSCAAGVGIGGGLGHAVTPRLPHEVFLMAHNPTNAVHSMHLQLLSACAAKNFKYLLISKVLTPSTE